jgi:hypothetical protein
VFHNLVLSGLLNRLVRYNQRPKSKMGLNVQILQVGKREKNARERKK